MKGLKTFSYIALPTIISSIVIIICRETLSANQWSRNPSTIRCLLSKNAFSSSVASSYRPIISFPIKLPLNLLQYKLDFFYRWKSHEDFTHKYLMDYMKNMNDNEIIIDVGCHVGDTGLLLAKTLKELGKKTIVYEIDPNKSKLDFISKMAIKNNLQKNIKTIHCGLSDKKGKGAQDKTKSHSGALRIEKGDDFEIFTVDELFKNKKIGLIHFDLEGFEFKALQGCKQIIDTCNPVILMEICHDKKAQGLVDSWGYRTLWNRENNTWNVKD